MHEIAAHESHGKEGDFNSVIGLRIVEATPDRVVAEIDVTPSLHQQYGIVPGSVGVATWSGSRITRSFSGRYGKDGYE
jgi:acyl-coenzyme A thioesterase PaaI-like protein